MHSRSHLMGSHPLTADAVSAHVPEQTPGAYVLGFKTHDVFTVQRVGRADENLRAHLAALAEEGRYRSFKFLPTATTGEAFDTECFLYHEFGADRHLDNESHPPRPAGARWICPHCSVFGIRDWRASAR
ncbi:MAG: hypothetical protein NW200_13705 [Hyphomonadaceae bacterium]|nr:hypothetical protein [Hyphomonadaceae bacterium]